VGVKHAFTSAKSDPADATKIGATKWNADHVGAFDVYNVKAYGAVGNGSTNDASAIQDALNACASDGGGMVLFPTGRYNLGTTSLTIGANNMHLLGAGRDNSHLIYTGSSSAAIKNSSASTIRNHCSVRDLGIEAHTSGAACIDVENFQYGDFSHLYLTSDYGNCMRLLGSDAQHTYYNVIYDCVFWAETGPSVLLGGEGGANRNDFIHCFWYTDAAQGNGGVQAIVVDGTTTGVILGNFIACHFEGNFGDQNAATHPMIDIGPNGADNERGGSYGMFIGCEIENHNTPTVQIKFGSTSRRNLVIGTDMVATAVVSYNIDSGNNFIGPLNTYRMDTGRVRFPDALVIPTNAGAVDDNVSPGTPVTGELWVDTTNNRLYFRVGAGSWKYVQGS
jgi:hypothetical protein